MIFPDSLDEKEKTTQEATGSFPVRGENDRELTWRLKSAPIDSLTYFMATVLCNINDMHGKCSNGEGLPLHVHQIPLL